MLLVEAIPNRVGRRPRWHFCHLAGFNRSFRQLTGFNCDFTQLAGFNCAFAQLTACQIGSRRSGV